MLLYTSITHFIGSVAFCLSPSPFLLLHILTAIKLHLLLLCRSLSLSPIFLSLSLPKGFQIKFPIHGHLSLSFAAHLCRQPEPITKRTLVVLTHLHSLTLLPFALPHFLFSLSFCRHSLSLCLPLRHLTSALS